LNEDLHQPNFIRSETFLFNFYIHFPHFRHFHFI
jgi:hypothetical protein